MVLEWSGEDGELRIHKKCHVKNLDYKKKLFWVEVMAVEYTKLC